MFYFAYSVDMLMLNDVESDAELVGTGILQNYHMAFKTNGDIYRETAVPTLEKYLGEVTEVTVWDIEKEDEEKLRKFADELSMVKEEVTVHLLDGTEVCGYLYVSTFEDYGLTGLDVLDILEEVYDDFGLDSSLVFRASSFSTLNMDLNYTPE